MQKKYIKKTILSLIILFILLSTPLASAKNANAVSTVGHTNITSTKVTLQGSVISNTEFPAGTIVNAYFRYSSKVNFPPVFCNDIYGSDMKSTNETKITLSSNDILFSTEISDLEPDTTYYFCAVASNKKNITYGTPDSFTTLTTGTSVTTENPTIKDNNSVYLNGFYNTAIQAKVWFEYRKKINDSDNSVSSSNKNGSSYAWSAKQAIVNKNKNTSGDFTFLLSGLLENTSYEYRAAIKGDSETNIKYGDIINFKTTNSSDVTTDYYPNTNYNNGGSTTNYNIGTTINPPSDAIVRYHEGIETVLYRQIVNNPTIAKTYGYTDGMNLSNFAWNLSDLFARIFGYVDENNKEIRVSLPDIAAYQLEIVNGDLTVYEFYNGVIVNIQRMTEILRNIYDYEYYFSR